MSGPDEDIRRGLSVLFEPGDVVELRAFRDVWTKSGYFDDLAVLAEEAAALDRGGWQAFVTMNPIRAALLERAPNVVVDRPARTTADKDIVRRRWLLVDIDPVRTSGASATKQEKSAAYERAKEVLAYLEAGGWPEPVIADSGNGFHFLFLVDLPNDAGSKRLVRGVLEALAAEFDDERVKVDTAVHNPSRLVRLYGTHNRKGEHTEERPHRRSKISKIPQEEV